jgi:hypothetical protein
MNKGQVIGLTVTALAVIGGIAVFNWVRKPKPNRDGFFNAEGTESNQRWCARRNPNGSVSYVTNNFSPTCGKGWKAVKYFGDRTGI